MEFLRPLLLWGLLGLSIPILIHLLGRRRVRVVRIATLRFLERARARAAARLRLRRWLLLLARLAVLGCLALLFAGPGCRTRAAVPGASHWVLILDTSPSMAVVRGGSSALEKAKAQLDRLLLQSGPEDRFLVLNTSDRQQPDDRLEFSADLSLVRTRIDRAQVAYGDHLPARAVERGVASLAQLARGRIVLATDLQAAGWETARVELPPDVSLQIIDVGPAEPANTWVDAAEERGAVWRVAVASSGPPPGDRSVSLYLDETKQMTAFLDNGSAEMRLARPPGLFWGHVQVAPGGDLAVDDRLFFVSSGRDRIRVLLVNGDPSGFEIRDETLFLRRALEADGGIGRRFQVREVRQGDLTVGQVAEADVVFLANPGPLPAALAAALEERVRAGAGLIVSGVDRRPAAEWLGTPLARLLAAPVRDRVVVPPDDPSRPPFERVEEASLAGPLAVFRSAPDSGLDQVRVTGYWVLDVRAGGDLDVWMGLENGAPLLVERQLDKGRSLLLATSVDRDAADLCLKPGFVPLLERLLLHAAGALRAPLQRRVAAGEFMTLPYDEPVRISGPEREYPWAPQMGAFVPPAPGVYRIFDGRGLVDAFAANMASRESDLTRLEPVRLDQQFGAGRYLLTREFRAGTGGSAGGRRDLSSVLGAALLALLLAELLLSTAWPRRRGTPELPLRREWL